MLRQSVIAAACALLALPGASIADDGAEDGPDQTHPPASEQAGGQHWRFKSQHGPVHVWVPAGYQPDTAGIVLYVHGYYSDVDEAWSRHGLAEQFAASGRNALFIAPEAPERGWDKVSWDDLGALIRAVRQEIGLARPWGPVVAIGHSGAYRTLLPWLDYRPLDHIILLDGLYGNEEIFATWLDQPKAHKNRLAMIAIDTIRWSEPWTRERGFAHTLDWMPAHIDAFTPEALDAQFLYIRSQYDHMDIVTKAKVIPILLQATRLPAVRPR